MLNCLLGVQTYHRKTSNAVLPASQRDQGRKKIKKYQL
jgi:hypothetical protein